MSARKKRWVLRDPAPPEFIATIDAPAPLIANLLYQRGLRDPHSVATFLSPDYKRGLHDPFLLKGMEPAAHRIIGAIQAGEPIAVYGDFDADGVTAVTLLMQAISAMGGDIQPYIPHRLREGYGLNHVATDSLLDQGVRLLVTVDCGISNVAEVAHARAAGLDVIVTDHHTPPAVLPDANVVINPKQPGDEYPFKQLVGVGIAYKLVQALSRLGMKMPLRGRDLLDVVAIGTVADMGPLNGENRVLVKAGLESVNSTTRPGLRALIAEAGLTNAPVTSGDIGYTLGPRLNAAGRLDDAVTAYKLLLSDNLAAAGPLAAELGRANRQRQTLTKELQAKARSLAEAQGKLDNRIIVLADPSFPGGVVGLVAGKLVEEWGRPVLLIERGEAQSRGSARSIPGFNMIEALTEISDVFVRFGGHAAAAGFTLEHDRIDELETRLLAYAATRLSDDMLVPVLHIDAEVSLNALNWDLLDTLKTLEPFGQSNPQPVLLSRRARVSGAWARGADGQHLKLRLDDGQGGPSYDAIAFRLGQLASYFATPRWIDVVYTLEEHIWNGQRSLQLNIKDFRRA